MNLLGLSNTLPIGGNGVFSLKVSVSKTVNPFYRDGNVGALEEPLTGMCEWVAIPCSMMPPILFILS